MPKKMRFAWWRAVLTVIGLMQGFPALAADSLRVDGGRMGVSVGGSWSYLMPKGSHNKRVIHTNDVGYLDARFSWKPRVATASDRALNDPTLEAGLLVGDFTHIHMQDPDRSRPSRVGREVAAYVGIQYDFLHLGRWRAGLNVQNGLAYFTERYSPDRNPDNELIGAPLSIYIALGPYIAYRLPSQWELALGADFRHVSNGTVWRPNLGANTVGPMVRLTAPVGRPAADAPPHSQGNPAPQTEETVGPLYLELSAGMAASTLRDEFIANRSTHTTLFGSPIAMAAPMYRYSQAMASGIELDYAYSTYANHIRDYDLRTGHTDYRYSRHVVGLGFRHEIFYRNFSLHCGIGKYLYRRMGHIAETQDGGNYQTIGLRYSLPFATERLFVGYNVKAHNFSKADCMQFHIGYRLGLL